MFRPSHLPLALAVAAVAAWPASTAYSTGVLTPKQAKLQGLVATAKQREQKVDKLIVKLRTPKSQALVAPMSATRAQSLAKTAGTGMKALHTTGGGAHVMQLDRAIPISEARAMAARLAQDAEIEYAEPDSQFRRLVTPNEVRFQQWQWNLFSPTAAYSAGAVNTTALGGANLPAAWDYTKGSESVIVAIIDSGIVNHPDLNGIANGDVYVPAGRFLPGYDFVSANVLGLPTNFVGNDGNGRDADPSDPGDWITAQEKEQYPVACTDGESEPYKSSDSSWHGSHVAGVVAATANNALGIAGIGWNVSVLPVRALGKCGGSLSDIEAAIRWSAGLSVPGAPTNPNPAKVINLSLGGGDTCEQTMQDAVDAAITAGAVVVAATGNGGGVGLISPANCSGVIAVTAHTISGDNADYANIGVGTTLSAPGGGSPFYSEKDAPKHVTDNVNFDGYYVFSSVLFGATTPSSSASGSSNAGPGYAGFVGTSAAAPHVAGVAALLKSSVSNATPAQIRSYLLNVRPYASGNVCAPGGGFAGWCGEGLLDAGMARTATGAPAAVAKTVAIVPPGATVTLNGSESTPASGKTIMAYDWTQRAGVAVTLNNANASIATFTAPAAGTLTFRLRVTDEDSKTGHDVVSLRVNSAPVLAAAPPARTATVGETVAFSVSATDADGDALTYTAGAASTVPLTALAPSGQFAWNTTGAQPGTYTLAYFATDGLAQSATQTVTITLTAGSSAVPPSGGGGGGGGSWTWAGIGLLLSLLLLRSAAAARQPKRQSQ